MRYAQPHELKENVVPVLSGSYIVVTYGEITSRAIVEVARSANAGTVVRELLSEVDVPPGAIEWKRSGIRTSSTRLKDSVASAVKRVKKAKAG